MFAITSEAIFSPIAIKSAFFATKSVSHVNSTRAAFEPSTLIAIANIMFYYDIGDVEYYQINKFLLKSIGIECESQLKDFIAKMKSAIN